MPEYIFSVITADGHYTQMHNTFVSDDDFLQFIEKKQYHLIHHKITTRKGNKPKKHLAEFCFYMAELDKAHIPLLQSIELMAHTLPALKTTLLGIYDQLNHGLRLSQALKTYPYIFDTVFIELVAMGEMTGRLYPYFDKLHTYLSWQNNLKAQIKQNTIYPLMLCGMVGVLIFFSTQYILPELQTFLKTLHKENLPFATQSLMVFARIVPYVVLSCAATLVAWIVLPRLGPTSFKYYKDKILLYTPVFGPLYRDLFVGIYLKILAIFIQEKITLMHGLAQAQATTSNAWLHHELTAIPEHLKQGLSLSQAFKQTRCFSETFLNLLEVSEKHGLLEQSLHHLSETMTKHALLRIERLMKMLEPAMLTIVGCVILWIVFAIWVPLYDSLKIV